MGILSASLQQLRNVALVQLVPCHVATTQREYQAISRLRYETYIREQNLTMAGADHEDEELWVPEEDEAPGVLHFYAGSTENLLGAMRARVWERGAVPEPFWNGYSMDLLPDMKTRTICEVSKLMVRPNLRGSAAMAALTSFAVYEVVRRHQNEVMVAVCVPGLVRRYESIGLRHFGGRLLSTPRGVVIPLIGLTNDVDHTFRIGSPWYPALRRLQREGRLPAELPAYRAQVAQDRSVVTEPREVQAELERFARGGRSAFVGDLPAQALPVLARHAMILAVPPDLTLCREEVADREVYLVLEGQFDVLREGKRLAQLGPGQLFGEMALLSKGGRRSAAVRSAGAGRVLVLRRKFLPEISRLDERMGRMIYEALVQELIRKLGDERDVPVEAS